MLDKATVGYHELAPGDRHPCLICRHYDAMRHRCVVVTGMIEPWGTCERWTAPSRPDREAA